MRANLKIWILSITQMDLQSSESHDQIHISVSDHRPTLPANPNSSSPFPFSQNIGKRNSLCDPSNIRLYDSFLGKLTPDGILAIFLNELFSQLRFLFQVIKRIFCDSSASASALEPKSRECGNRSKCKFHKKVILPHSMVLFALSAEQQPFSFSNHFSDLQ
jgi:hypothetical protein